MTSEAVSRLDYIDPLSQKKYELMRCPHCDVEFWTPLEMPPASYYEQSGGDYKEFHETGSDELKWWHRTFLQHFSGLQSRGRILDIGCADGRLLKKLKAEGWDIYGIDLDRKSVEVARKNCQTDHIYHGLLDDCVGNFEPHSFDVITFFEVLEHQPRPIHFMNQVRTLIKPGGWIGGSVPNRSRYVVKQRFSPDNPPHHFTLWTEHAIRTFMDRQGLEKFSIFFTRFEPHIIDQIFKSIMYDRLLKLKGNLGVETFAAGGEQRGVASLISIIKRLVWNPLLWLISWTEYPYLFAMKKSISMFFEAQFKKETRSPG
jgi:SAM-dependent methyltransferase